MSWCIGVVSSPKNMITIINADDTLSMENEVTYVCVCVYAVEGTCKCVLPEALLSFTLLFVISSYCFFRILILHLFFICMSLFGISFSISFTYK